MKSDELKVQLNEENIFLKRQDCCYDRTPLNLIIILIIAACVVLMFRLKQYYNTFLIIACITCALYILEVFLANTFRFIYNTMKYNQAFTKISNLMSATPVIGWTIHCYHYERRQKIVYTKDSNGNESSHYETEEVKVYTHSASTTLKYQGCSDVSNVMDCMKHLELLQYCRIYLTKSFGFIDSDSAANYNYQREGFISTNNLDTHYDLNESFDISGFVSRIVTYGGSDGASMPCMYKMGTYLFLSLIFLGWIVRICLYKNSFAASTKIHKILKV